MKHQIIVRYTNRRDKNPALTVHLHRCITAALAAEGVNVPCEINVLVTDDEGIRAINNATRNIDSATDVLSFPMSQFTPAAFPDDVSEDTDRPAAAGGYGDLSGACQRSGKALRQYDAP